MHPQALATFQQHSSNDCNQKCPGDCRFWNADLDKDSSEDMNASTQLSPLPLLCGGNPSLRSFETSLDCDLGKPQRRRSPAFYQSADCGEEEALFVRRRSGDRASRSQCGGSLSNKLTPSLRHALQKQVRTYLRRFSPGSTMAPNVGRERKVFDMRLDSICRSFALSTGSTVSTAIRTSSIADSDQERSTTTNPIFLSGGVEDPLEPAMDMGSNPLYNSDLRSSVTLKNLGRDQRGH